MIPSVHRMKCRLLSSSQRALHNLALTHLLSAVHPPPQRMLCRPSGSLGSPTRPTAPRAQGGLLHPDPGLGPWQAGQGNAGPKVISSFFLFFFFFFSLRLAARNVAKKKEPNMVRRFSMNSRKKGSPDHWREKAEKD